MKYLAVILSLPLKNSAHSSKVAPGSFLLGTSHSIKSIIKHRLYIAKYAFVKIHWTNRPQQHLGVSATCRLRCLSSTVRGGQAKWVLSPQMDKPTFRCSEWSFLNIYITDILLLSLAHLCWQGYVGVSAARIKMSQQVGVSAAPNFPNGSRQHGIELGVLSAPEYGGLSSTKISKGVSAAPKRS